MQLTNEFEVAVPVEEVWPALLDIERVARFLPGAEIEPASEAGVYNGSMKVKLGPMAVTYRGTARLGEVDEESRSAAIEVEAREARGQGRAAATINNRLEDLGGRTRVVAETDLRITGRQAQFGRGIMQDVASAMLDDFARRFEASLLGEAPDSSTGGTSPTRGASAEAEPETEGVGGARPAPATAGPPDALDMGAIMSGTRTARYGAAVLGCLAALWLVRALRRRCAAAPLPC